MIAIYARVSTQEQAQNGHSIDEQVERMKKYCDAMGWKLFKPYIDAGYTGANIDRPALKTLLDDIQKGNIEKVLVYKLDRLSRSQKDTLYLIEDEFLANGVSFVSMCENFDTTTPFGMAMIGILAVFAQLEREQIKERMRMGKEARANQGKFSGGTCPIGYDYKDNCLTVNQYEAIQVAEVYRLALAGKGIDAIAVKMNEEGYKHKYGSWSSNTVRNVLSSRVYTGEISFGGEWYQSDHEPIIDKGTYENVRKILCDRLEWAVRYNSRLGKANTYLSGMLFCAHCGAKYAKRTIQSRNKSGKIYTYPYYCCNSRARKRDYLIKDPNCRNRSWRVEELDEVVFSEIRKLALEPIRIDEKSEYDKENKRTAIAAELEKLNAKISRLLDLYGEGDIPTETLSEKIAEINHRKKEFETIEESLNNDDDGMLGRFEAEKTIKSFGDVLERGNFDEIRLILSMLIRKIELDDETVKIYWNF